MKIISIDTEFERRRTYVPILSIIQIKENDKDSQIIDCYHNKDELILENIKKILLDENILKVFHSCQQDIEAIYYYFNIIPKNIFDTQIAAKYSSFNNNGNQVSYGTLVKSILNIDINKDMQKSNWLKRPLSDEQTFYAKEDVKYLKELYHYFKNNIDSVNFEKILVDCENMLDENLYKFNPVNFWNKSKYQEMRIDEKKIEKLKKLIIWREKTAFKRNIPRQFVITNQELVAFVKGETEVYQNSRNYIRYKKYLDNYFEKSTTS